MLKRRRPLRSNLALAGTLKIELIAELLRRGGHVVEILSQGEVVENSATFYPALAEANPSESAVPVRYASALPIRFINGRWSSNRLKALFKERHQATQFDLVILYNMKLPQLACGHYAYERLGLPVILEYEDDALVDIGGRYTAGLREKLTHRSVNRMLQASAGAIGASPFLLGRLPKDRPSLLLRGVISDAIADCPEVPVADKRNWVTFSGTLFRSKGVEPLLQAWKSAPIDGWELHIAGDGELAERVRAESAGQKSIVLHGMLGRSENAALLRQSKICINPHELSETPGNVFAFKIVEYLAAGSHVITTPMGELEADLERGITYIPDNRPATIVDALHRVIVNHQFSATATREARARYGPDAVARSLDILIKDVVKSRPSMSTPLLASRHA